MTEQSKRVRGEHGWFAKGLHSYTKLLHTQAVKDWIDMYTSKNTRIGYLRSLEAVCNFSELSPAELLELNDTEAKRIIKRAVAQKIQQGKLNFARKMMQASKSFFESNDRDLRFRRSERVRLVNKRILREHIPSKAELYKMSNSAYSLRNKAIILCLFQSGVRVGCLTNWIWGLVKDQLYPELKIPIYLKVTHEMDTKLGGYGLPYYYTFLAFEAAKALKDYLDYRVQRGWKPKLEDPLFVTEGSVSRGRKIKISNIWEMVKRSGVKSGLKYDSIWVHVIRKTFRKVLNRGLFDEDTKEALMGHKLAGSRGNYFDYHDVDEIAKKYMLADWGPDGGSRLNHLESELTKAREKTEESESRMTKMELMNLKLKDRINGLTEGRSREIGELKAEMKAEMKAEREKMDRRWMKIVGDFERMLRDSTFKEEKGRSKEKTSA